VRDLFPHNILKKGVKTIYLEIKKKLTNNYFIDSLIKDFILLREAA